MSSILDALKKVEQEKAHPAEELETPMDAVTARQELLGARRASGSGVVKSVLIGVAAFSFCSLLVAVAVTVAMVAISGDDVQPVPAVTQHAQAISPPRPLGSLVETSEPRVLPAAPDEPLPAPAAAVHAPVVAPPAPVAPAPVAVASAPNEASLEQRSLQVETPSLEGEPEVDPAGLPFLSLVERRRLGLPELKLNFVSMSSRRRPRPMALINFRKVYLHDTIPDTNAELIAITMGGIGIKVEGKRYFVPTR